MEMPSQPISVSGLKRIVDHSVDDLTITVEAGLPLADLQMVLKKHQAHFSKIKDIFVYKESNLSGFVLISPAEKSSHTGGHGLP